MAGSIGGIRSALIYISMPLYMLGVFCLGYFLLGLHGAEALLLASVCAPTDPVMATEMQLDDKGEDDRHNTGLRYLLTAEAGLNDGMAFPFVFLAVLWSKSASFEAIPWADWFSFYLVYKIVAGILIGAIFGYLYSWSLNRIHERKQLKALSGFVAIALGTVLLCACGDGLGLRFSERLLHGTVRPVPQP